jgi:hypothetical protein
MSLPKIKINPMNPHALNPGGKVYALYKVYPKTRWFLGYYRAEEDYMSELRWLDQHETDPKEYEIWFELDEMSDYGIPAYKIFDAQRDREIAQRKKTVERLRRKYRKRHPTYEDIEYRKYRAREKRRSRRDKKKDKPVPPQPLDRRCFPELLKCDRVLPTCTPAGIRIALSYLYK